MPMDMIAGIVDLDGLSSKRLLAEISERIEILEKTKSIIYFLLPKDIRKELSRPVSQLNLDRRLNNALSDHSPR